MSYSMNY